jgi:hypothetical protein
LLDSGEFSFANAQVGQPGRAEMNERAYRASLQRHPKQLLEFRNGRVFWSWSENGAERSRAEWSFRLPLIKDGVEWGWLNLYRRFDSEALLVDPNYLSNLFRREFTDAAARILLLHELPVVDSPIRLEVSAKKASG